MLSRNWQMKFPAKYVIPLAGGDKNAGQRTKSDEKAHPGNRG